MRRTNLLAALTSAVAIVGCSSGGNGSSQAHTDSVVGSAPAGISSPGPTSSPRPRADRIVSLSPSATETLFAMGAGDQVVGVDDRSNYPSDALAKPHDLSALSPDLDRLGALNPDLVVIADDTSGLTSQLAERGIAVLIEPPPTSLDLVFDQIDNLGAVSGHATEASQLAHDMQSAIDAAVAGSTPPSRPLTYYHELDNTYTSITENTLTGQIYALFGLQSIADFQEVSSDTPQLSADVIISSDPDLIFLADAETPATVSARPGWAKLRAVTNGNVVALDGDVSSRWGPRLVDFVQAIADATNKAN